MTERIPMSMQRISIVGLVLVAAALPGCESGGHFTFLGYTSRPNYDTCIKSVFVPIFQSNIMLDETRRQMPFDLTRAVVKEIEAKTPYKVVSDRCKADTELSGTIMSLNKNLLIRNQLNEIREGETTLVVGVVWRDVRSGEILSRPRKGQTCLPTPGIPALDIPEINGQPAIPPPTLPDGKPNPANAPVLVTGLGDYIPELGQSTTTAYQQSIKKVAVEIVSLMEKPW